MASTSDFERDLRQRLFICNAEERINFQSQKLSHVISITNPGATPIGLDWFKGAHLQLCFGDVISEEDARRCKTSAPTNDDIQAAVEYFRAAWKNHNSKILISCDQGASRSPALAYVLIADLFGTGREKDALEFILRIRPTAVPNALVVRLGDHVLSREGALRRPLSEFYAQINAELFDNP